MTKMSNDISPDVQAKVSSMTGKDPDTLNSVYSNLLNMVSCDSDCQERMNIDALREKWKDAELTQKNAPESTKQAEKNYLIAKEGEEGYNETMFKRYTNIATTKRKTALNKQKHVVKDIYLLVDQYCNDTRSYSKMKELLKIKLLENKELKKKLDDELQSAETNDRKVVYENWAKDGLSTTYKILLIVYVIACLVYLFVKVRDPNFDYKKITTWIPVLVLIIIPFIIKIIALACKKFYHLLNYYLNNKAPKNVYKDL